MVFVLNHQFQCGFYFLSSAFFDVCFLCVVVFEDLAATAFVVFAAGFFSLAGDFDAAAFFEVTLAAGLAAGFLADELVFEAVRFLAGFAAFSLSGSVTFTVFDFPGNAIEFTSTREYCCRWPVFTRYRCFARYLKIVTFSPLKCSTTVVSTVTLDKWGDPT